MSISDNNKVTVTDEAGVVNETPAWLQNHKPSIFNE